jgi:ketosteroid isomerase-like protein
MSQENVELVRRAAEALMRRDRITWLAVADEDFELVPISDWPEPTTVRGAEAGWDFYLDFFDVFEGFPMDAAEIVDAGSDKVLLHYRAAISGKESGAGVRFDYWLVITVRQGKSVRAQWFADRDVALEVAGLSE